MALEIRTDPLSKTVLFPTNIKYLLICCNKNKPVIKNT